jgi:hypothetical protein
MVRERPSTLLILELTDHGWSQTLREHDRKLIHQHLPPLTLLDQLWLKRPVTVTLRFNLKLAKITSDRFGASSVSFSKRTTERSGCKDFPPGPPSATDQHPGFRIRRPSLLGPL